MNEREFVELIIQKQELKREISYERILFCIPF
ncbi:hypothetical protein OCC_13500 [Thermococcus litoralis DSM 5473]|uniref:Uncharacterized protein n=1 Tax=Thermococcus litoralis (strain ATCC 51850 / DSM 5473 / JCM 8560 / NS-C) TaxID=523849 RepID=S5ZTL1_THELN|nr:hypothetical protein OCC_13500 [Thermococcus litoralis DSM 5473]